MYVITKIYIIDIHTARRNGIFSKAGRVFSDFRDKFNKALRTLVKNYNNLDEEVEVSEFIDDNVWRSVLSSHLDATKKMDLMDDHHTLSKLREFVQAAFAIQSDASLAVKGLDYITIDLKIPTQLNIVSEMDVRKLIKCRGNKNSQYRCLSEDQ